METVPYVNGRDLSELVAAFEVERGFDAAGGYAGIIPAYFRYGPLRDYYMGAEEHPYWGPIGKIAVLGCECGEVGCWPLYAEVQTDADSFTWLNFEQPHRRGRDYGDFGPFRFARGEYEASLADLTDLEANDKFT
jgi:hypothetical protein